MENHAVPRRRLSEAESPEPRSLSILGTSLESPVPSDDEAGGAGDLSQGRFGLLGRSLEYTGFHRLQVLILAGSALKTQQLGMVLAESKQLTKLDASHCSLVQTPEAELFAGLAQLAVLFLHKNQLARWADIERAVQAPALAWLTAFENPIASQPEFRDFVIDQKPRILAVDHWVVTDGEHVGFSGGSHGSRFAVQNQESVVDLKSHPPLLEQTRHALVREAQQELWSLRHKCNHCSAACAIQTAYRGSCDRRKVAKVQRVQLRAVMMVQRRARTFLWRRRMLAHLKDYLAEIDELDLLLSAKEMLRLRAAKLIEVAVRRWIGRRNQWKIMRRAAECVNRATRGFIARRQVLRNHLELTRYRRIYFPEEYKWEFLVMLNMVMRSNGLPLLSREHKFHPADVVGIRIPDTDEVPKRDSSLMAVLRFARHCIVRPLRSNRRNRYPDHDWDGPFHSIVDKSAEMCRCATRSGCKCSFQAKLNRAYAKVRRRGANVDGPSRKIFKLSCCPDNHPIDCPINHTDPDPKEVSLVLKAILEGPESNWPIEAQNEGHPANLFMREARELGSRPRRGGGPGKGIYDSRSVYTEPETGLPCYRNACWLSQRMLYHECQSEKVVLDMLMLLVRLSRDNVRIPMVKPVPFLAQKDVRNIAAVTVIQSAWRAHCVRCNLACGLRMATVMRRAAICIQRGWRWGLLKRRLELLTGAVKYVSAVKSTTLYIEDRLYTALNVIGSVDRYPPLLQERMLGLGYAESDNNGSIVLVRSDMRGMTKMKGNGASSAAREAVRKRSMNREGGLPMWFMSRVGELRAVGPDDSQLVKVSGLQGLLIEGLGDRPDDERVPISMASIKHAAKLAADSNDGTSPALVASAGNFKFVELKFHSLVQARQRALLLYLCTFNAKYHVVVPFLSKSSLHDVSVCQDILRLWDLFGLTWPAGDRAGPYQLKQKGIRPPTEVVPLSGSQPMRHIGQGEWQKGSGTDKKFTGWTERRAKIAEETRQRYEQFSKQYEEKQRRDVQKQRDRLQETSIERLHEGQATGALDACVTGALPPATATRVLENPAAIVYAEKVAAKTLIQEAKEAEKQRVQQLHDSVFESRREKDVLCFEEKIRAFHDERGDNTQQAAQDEKFEKKGRTQDFHLELAHKRAENDIIAKAQMMKKKMSLSHITPRDMKELKKERTEELERQNELARFQRQEEKMLKAGRKEAAKMLQKFLSKSHKIQDACYKYDKEREREEKLLRKQENVENHKHLWAQRSAALADCNEIRQQFKMGQVEDMKRQIDYLKAISQQKQECELQQQRWHIKAQQSSDSFLKAARAELDGFQEDEMSILRETFMRAAQSVPDVGLDVEQLIGSLHANDVSVDGKEGEQQHSWEGLGWKPKRTPRDNIAETSSASSDIEGITGSLSSTYRMKDSKDKVVASMLRHADFLQGRTSPHQQTNVMTITSPLEPWHHSAPETGTLLFAEPVAPAVQALVGWPSPPARPALEPPKPSPMLPPRTLRPTVGLAQRLARGADQVPAASHKEDMVPDPSRRFSSSAASDEEVSSSADGHANPLESDVVTVALELALDEQGDADQVRTMPPKKQSKKNGSSATLNASSATLTTGVGSSATGSVATLPTNDSSQASLPIRLPPLPPPPRPAGAPRGIFAPRRPPLRGSSQPPPRPGIQNITIASLEGLRGSNSGNSATSSLQRGRSPGDPGWKTWSLPLTAR